MKDSNQEGSQRRQVLRDLLTNLRIKETDRVRALREDRSGDVSEDPGDTLDEARADEDLELHAALIDRAENRLTEIHEALKRLDDGTYGICRKCKNEIELERLKAMPFAELCGKCVGIQREDRAPGEESREFESRWQPPEGIESRLGDKEPLEEPDRRASDLAGENFVPAAIAEPRRRSVRKAAARKKTSVLKKTAPIAKKVAPSALAAKKKAAAKKAATPKKNGALKKSAAAQRKAPAGKKIAARAKPLAKKKIVAKKSTARKKSPRR